MNASTVDLMLAEGAGLSVWRVLDTRFDAGRLLALWQAWRTMAQPCRVLHLVALAAEAPDAADLLPVGHDPERARMIAELTDQWHGLLPGFHRFSIEGGRFQLTLCLGDLQLLLEEQAFAADGVFLDRQLRWDQWRLKALARCCRRGTRIVAEGLSAALDPLLRQAGFVMTSDTGRYDPHWTVKARQAQPVPVAPTGCAVIGAGLAGASMAAALARRGWQVQVLDAAPMPAAGASGLPVGLLMPHASVDDSPRSRLSRVGVRQTQEEARRLLQAGRDWAPSGVLERRIGRSLGLPADWPSGRTDITQAAPPGSESWHAGAEPSPERWHPQGAWIKPAALVRAWLAQDGVQFTGLCAVHRLRQVDGLWQLLDRSGRVLARAEHVVLANAIDVVRLLDGMPGLIRLPELHALRGVVSAGLRRPGDHSALPPWPVNGLGSLIPAVPTEDGLSWYTGATYEDARGMLAPAEMHHRDNLTRLGRLLPAAAQALAGAFAPGSVRGWGGTRCAGPGRLPLVGPLEVGDQPTLWISAAMASRGLTFAPLCAELLAARMGCEPLPMEATLAARLAASRFVVSR